MLVPYNQPCMAWLIGLLVFGLGGGPDSPSAQQLWAANLTTQYGFQKFDREINRNWLAQQGLAFLSPERIVVYQVNQKPQRMPLAARDITGGAGNFYIQLEILDVRDGHEVAHLQLPAAGLFSSVMPTRDGNFIVRSGEGLSLYSASLQQLATYSLPLEKGESQAWETQVASSGDTVVAVRRQMYIDPSQKGRPSYVELLDAATLHVKKAFTMSRAGGWMTTVGDRHMLSFAGEGKLEWGLTDFDGHWDPIPESISRLDGIRYYRLGLLSHDYLAIYGQNQLIVLASPTQALLRAVEPKQFFQSVMARDHFLAAEIVDKPIMYKQGHAELPGFAQIDAYDLDTQAKLISVKVSPKGLYFAISPKGDLGIIHDNRLQVLRGKSK
jgi:hypothetical protein